MENKRDSTGKRKRKRNNSRDREKEKGRGRRETQIVSSIAEACVSGAHLLPA